MEMPRIPDRLFFKISEVADITGVKPYVLRYWESEFQISPAKSKANQRVYEKKDIEIILRIKKLLYVEMFTIAGAKKRLKEEIKSGVLKNEALESNRKKRLEEIKTGLKELHHFIHEKSPPSS